MNVFIGSLTYKTECMNWNYACISWGGLLQSYQAHHLHSAHFGFELGPKKQSNNKKIPKNENKIKIKVYRDVLYFRLDFLAFQALQRTPTYLFLIWDAHDPHSFHGLLKHIFVLLTRDRDMPIGKEAVFVVRLQK